MSKMLIKNTSKNRIEEIENKIKNLEKQKQIIELAEKIALARNEEHPEEVVDLDMVLNAIDGLKSFDDASIYCLIMSHSKIVDGKIVQV